MGRSVERKEFMVMKATPWRSPYRRLLVLTREGMCTMDPETGRQTNNWPTRSLEDVQLEGGTLHIVANNLLLGCTSFIAVGFPSRFDLTLCVPEQAKEAFNDVCVLRSAYNYTPLPAYINYTPLPAYTRTEPVLDIGAGAVTHLGPLPPTQGTESKGVWIHAPPPPALPVPDCWEEQSEKAVAGGCVRPATEEEANAAAADAWRSAQELLDCGPTSSAEGAGSWAVPERARGQRVRQLAKEYEKENNGHMIGHLVSKEEFAAILTEQGRREQNKKHETRRRNSLHSHNLVLVEAPQPLVCSRRRTL